MTFVISLIKPDIGKKITKEGPFYTEIKSEQEIKICHSLSVVVVVVCIWHTIIIRNMVTPLEGNKRYIYI